MSSGSLPRVRSYGLLYLRTVEYDHYLLARSNAIYTGERHKESHDDVIKWKHFPRYWPFVRGIHRSPVNSPHKGQWRGALMFSLICVWINGWVNNSKAGDLRRYPVHYDVIVMGHRLQVRSHFTTSRSHVSQERFQRFGLSHGRFRNLSQICGQKTGKILIFRSNDWHQNLDKMMPGHLHGCLIARGKCCHVSHCTGLIKSNRPLFQLHFSVTCIWGKCLIFGKTLDKMIYF